MKKKLTVFISIICLISMSSVKLTAAEEKYEKISPSDYGINMLMKGRVDWDNNGIVNGGPIAELSFWGKKVVLNNSMIKNSFIDTKDYGKIMVVSEGMHLAMKLTPSQKKKILELKKK